MHRVSIVAALALLCPLSAPARELTSTEEKSKSRWSFELEGLYFALRGDTDYALFLAHADRGPLHLEARYNYEDLHTGSAFVGWNLGVGEQLRLDITPMVGGVVGRTAGIAPGLEFELSYWKLYLYSENEYVFALGGRGTSFFYTWSELSLWPVDWARVGLNLQVTRLTGTSPVTEPGFHVGLAYRNFSAAAYFFKPGAPSASVVFLLAAEL